MKQKHFPQTRSFVDLEVDERAVVDLGEVNPERSAHSVQKHVFCRKNFALIVPEPKLEMSDRLPPFGPRRTDRRPPGGRARRLKRLGRVEADDFDGDVKLGRGDQRLEEVVRDLLVAGGFLFRASASLGPLAGFSLKTRRVWWIVILQKKKFCTN